MHELTFYLSDSEIQRVNGMLTDCTGSVDADTPVGTAVFFRSSEFANGYDATIAVLAGKPNTILEVVLFDQNGVPVAGERKPTDQICQEFHFHLKNGQHYRVTIAKRD
jgi:hypothetical protein